MATNPHPAFVKVIPSERNDTLMGDCKKVSGLLNRLNVYLIINSQLPDHREKATQFRIVSAALISAGVSLTSILKLNSQLSMQVRDALVLSRVFYETLLNCAFICGDSGERANRAEAYAILRAYQSQRKYRKIGQTSALFENDRGLTKSDPRVAEAMKMFRKQNGKLEKTCFQESRDEIISKILSEVPHAGVFLSAIEGMMYDLSSELAHGSYFGFLESSGGGKLDDATVLEGHAELVGYTVLFSASSAAHAIQNLLGENLIAKEIIEIADCYLRELAAEENLPYPKGET